MAISQTSAKIKCKPFLKWAGGKARLIPELSKQLPEYNHYFEPFIGGGAFFFYLQPPQATLIDVNPELTNVYLTIKNNVEALILDLKKHIHSKEYFYEIRNIDRDQKFLKWSNLNKASRFIYLNKTCYNGLYRVNSKGQFNVPFGAYKNPTILDESNLRACSQALQNTTILTGSFLQVENLAQQNDFIYFDPPYAPLSPTAYFTGYSTAGFNEQMQIALRDLCDRLTQKQIKWMQSNSSAELIFDLYQNKTYAIKAIDAARAINSKADKRGKIKELMITNY
jgi:DNA adenine methylase